MNPVHSILRQLRLDGWSHSVVNRLGSTSTTTTLIHSMTLLRQPPACAFVPQCPAHYIGPARLPAQGYGRHVGHVQGTERSNSHHCQLSHVNKSWSIHIRPSVLQAAVESNRGPCMCRQKPAGTYKALCICTNCCMPCSAGSHS